MNRLHRRRPAPIRHPRFLPSAFTLPEMILAAVLLAGIIAALIAATNQMRDRAQTVQARKLLQTLARATQEYARLQASQPPTYPPGTFDASATTGLTALLALPTTRQLLARLDWPWNRFLDRPARWADPWGTPLRYVTAVHDPSAVRLNGGRPFWVCAGPNRRFGDDRPAERADNISTDEPM